MCSLSRPHGHHAAVARERRASCWFGVALRDDDRVGGDDVDDIGGDDVDDIGGDDVDDIGGDGTGIMWM
jgi:hypothetical protein